MNNYCTNFYTWVKNLWKRSLLYLSLMKLSSKVGDHSCGRPKGSLFNRYYTEMYGRVLLLSLDCSTLLLICTLEYWVLTKEVSRTSLWYDATWDWAQVSQTIGEHSIHWSMIGLVSLHINHCGLIIAKSSFTYIYQIYIIWFGRVLWHINYCRLSKLLFIHI